MDATPFIKNNKFSLTPIASIAAGAAKIVERLLKEEKWMEKKI